MWRKASFRVTFHQQLFNLLLELWTLFEWVLNDTCEHSIYLCEVRIMRNWKRDGKILMFPNRIFPNLSYHASHSYSFSTKSILGWCYENCQHLCKQNKNQLFFHFYRPNETTLVPTPTNFWATQENLCIQIGQVSEVKYQPQPMMLDQDNFLLFVNSKD